jgi:hypothetical protein
MQRMNAVKVFPLVLACTSLLFANLSQAMEIRQFDKMADVDQITYIDDLRINVENSVPPAQLERVKRFYKSKQPGEVISGMGQFELNLALARVADLQQPEKYARARRLGVEDVMYVTLERNGISLPPGFRPVAMNFQAKLPPRKDPMTLEAAVRALADTRTWVARDVAPPTDFHASSGGFGLSDTDKGVAFFAALAVLVATAAAKGGDKGEATSGAPADNRTWWEQNGYNSYGDAVHGACVASHTPQMIGGYSGIC